MSLESIIQDGAQIAIAVTLGLWIFLPIIMVIIGSARRSTGVMSFLSMLFIYPTNVALRTIFNPTNDHTEVSTIDISDDNYTFRIHTFPQFRFQIKQSELTTLCDKYLEYNELPLDGKDYPFFEEHEFYEGVNLAISSCDHCGSNGTHLLVGRAFNTIPVKLIVCSDCFNEAVGEISTQIEENPEVLLSSQI